MPLWSQEYESDAEGEAVLREMEAGHPARGDANRSPWPPAIAVRPPGPSGGGQPIVPPDASPQRAAAQSLPADQTAAIAQPPCAQGSPAPGCQQAGASTVVPAPAVADPPRSQQDVVSHAPSATGAPAHDCSRQGASPSTSADGAAEPPPLAPAQVASVPPPGGGDNSAQECPQPGGRADHQGLVATPAPGMEQATENQAVAVPAQVAAAAGLAMPDASTQSGEKPEWHTEEDGSQERTVFLITFAALLAQTMANFVQTSGRRPRDVTKMTRRQILDAVMDAISNPVVSSRHGGRPRKHKLEILKLLVFMEHHMDGRVHFHAALKLNLQRRWLPFKLALMLRHGLVSHWSTTHTALWSIIRYLAFTTERKPIVDNDWEWWTKDGVKPDVFEEGQENFSATRWKARRDKREREAFAEPEPGAAQKVSRKAARFTKLDFIALVIAKDLRKPAAVIACSHQKGSDEFRSFICRNQRKLKEFIEDAAEWAAAEEAAAAESLSDWDLASALAVHITRPCLRDGVFYRRPAADSGQRARCEDARLRLCRVPVVGGGRRLLHQKQCCEEHSPQPHCERLCLFECCAPAGRESSHGSGQYREAE